MTEVLAVLAAAWAVLMGLAPLLQIRRMVKRGSADDVSVGYLGVLVPGFALWIAYGLSSANMALIVPNVVALLVAALAIVVAVRLRRATHR
ncbi:MAG: hypothetical protein K0S37_4056 [Microbacterium sp.]|jgi:uncharacterized protein with PQ loop repeat|nr:hypothetical protein [Microbacterium sp.]